MDTFGIKIEEANGKHMHILDVYVALVIWKKMYLE